MRPLLLLVSFIVGLSYGKPGGSYSYPSPTPPTEPAVLSNLGIPSPNFNLQTPTASVAPQVFLPSPAPPIISLVAPSIAPSLLVENVVGAGQYGPLVNIGAQPLTIQSLGLQSFGGQPGLQSVGNQLGFQSLGSQSGFQSLGSQSGLQSVGSQSGFQPLGSQSGFQALGSQSGLQSLGSQSGFQPLGSQSGLQSVGSQSGFQLLGSQSGLQSVGSQSGFQTLGSQSGLQSVGSQSGFQTLGSQSGLQSVGSQSGVQSFGSQSFSFGPSQQQIGLPFGNQGLDLGQAGFNFGGSFLGTGSPQLSFAAPPQVSPTPSADVSFSSSQLSPGAAGQTIAIPRPGVQTPNFQRSGDVIVRKHVYVHVAPEEPEERAPPRQIVIPTRKNYRIIFIKAPSPPPLKVPVLPPPALEEERTLIYVLVKKPEEQPEIKIQTPAPTQPAKPEVYFIKYNVEKEGIFGGGSLPIGPSPVEGGSGGNLPNVDDVSRGNDPTIPTVRIGGPGLHTSVDVNLNKATLDTDVDLNLNKAALDTDVDLNVNKAALDTDVDLNLNKGSLDTDVDLNLNKVTLDTNADLNLNKASLDTDVDLNLNKSTLDTNVDLNLNKASLEGGSALSLAVAGSPKEGTLHVSSTPPTFGSAEEK